MTVKLGDTTLHCDLCGREQAARGSTGWFHLERHRENVATVGLGDPEQNRDDWDLCSTTCLEAMASRLAGRPAVKLCPECGHSGWEPDDMPMPEPPDTRRCGRCGARLNNRGPNGDHQRTWIGYP